MAFTRSTIICIDNALAGAALRVCSACCTWHFLGQDNAAAGVMNAIIDTHCVLGEKRCADFVLIKCSLEALVLRARVNLQHQKSAQRLHRNSDQKLRFGAHCSVQLT